MQSQIEQAAVCNSVTQRGKRHGARVWSDAEVPDARLCTSRNAPHTTRHLPAPGRVVGGTLQPRASAQFCMVSDPAPEKFASTRHEAFRATVVGSSCGSQPHVMLGKTSVRRTPAVWGALRAPERSAGLRMRGARLPASQRQSPPSHTPPTATARLWRSLRPPAAAAPVPSR